MWEEKKKVAYTFLTVTSIAGHSYITASVGTAAPANIPKLVRASLLARCWQRTRDAQAARRRQEARRSKARQELRGELQLSRASARGRLRHVCVRWSRGCGCWVGSPGLRGTGAYLIE